MKISAGGSAGGKWRDLPKDLLLTFVTMIMVLQSLTLAMDSVITTDDPAKGVAAILQHGVKSSPAPTPSTGPEATIMSLEIPHGLGPDLWPPLSRSDAEGDDLESMKLGIPQHLGPGSWPTLSNSKAEGDKTDSMSLGIPQGSVPAPGSHLPSSEAKPDDISIKPPIVIKGSWTLHNLLPDNIKLHCRSQLYDLKDGDFVQGSTVTHEFDVNFKVNEVWWCQFDWFIASVKMHMRQDFEVWAHDGRKGFLEQCLACEWLVARDGFYYKDVRDGKWYWETHWYQIRDKSE